MQMSPLPAFGIPCFTFQPPHFSRHNRKITKTYIPKNDTPQIVATAQNKRPHVVVLPGMDGSGVLLEDFAAGLQREDISRKVVKVQYPTTTHLTFDDLRQFVVSDYLSEFEGDPRGYIVVCQSYSAHVGFRLQDGNVPGILLGQVHVNGFAAPPGPRIFRGQAWLFPEVLFERPPPAWLASQLLLGGDAPNMRTVQMAGAGVTPSVMAARLQDCLTEDSWHRWRSPHLVQGDRTLFLCGAADPVVGSTALAKKMRQARRDVGWVEVLHGPHLLLQRFGYRCALAVNDFFDGTNTGLE